MRKGGLQGEEEMKGYEKKMRGGLGRWGGGMRGERYKREGYNKRDKIIRIEDVCREPRYSDWNDNHTHAMEKNTRFHF